MRAARARLARRAVAALTLALAASCAGCASKPAAPVQSAPVLEDEVPAGVKPLTREVEEIGGA